MIYGILNRMALACATVGLAISTVLTVSHTSKIPLPCGTGTGCERVAQDPSSMYLGVPVSAYGMMAYVLLVILSILRINGVAMRISSLAGLLISLVGTVNSAYLTYHSITKIQATCMWCLGSAAMMVLSTILYLATPKASEGIRDGGKPISAWPWAILPVLPVVAYAIFGQVYKELPPDMSSVKLSKASLAVLENSSHSLGQKSAPVTIVEFADLMCPACRDMHMRLLLFISRNKGKARLLYHPFPLSKLEGHEDSQYAATLAEQLNPDGFWGFVSHIYNLKEKPNRADLDALMATFTAKKALDPHAAGLKILEDIKIGEDLGVKLTPTYIIFIGDKPDAVASSVDIKDVIKRPEFVKIFAPPHPASASKTTASK